MAQGDVLGVLMASDRDKNIANGVVGFQRAAHTTNDNILRNAYFIGGGSQGFNGTPSEKYALADIPRLVSLPINTRVGSWYSGGGYEWWQYYIPVGSGDANTNIDVHDGWRLFGDGSNVHFEQDSFINKFELK